MATKQVEFYNVNGRWATAADPADLTLLFGTTDLTTFAQDGLITRGSVHDYGDHGQAYVEVEGSAWGGSGVHWLRLSLTDTGSIITKSWCDSNGGGGQDTPAEAEPYLGC